MQYKPLGNTGILVSEIGLGCEGFNNKDEKETQELFDYAIAQGVNCMDLYSPKPDLHKRLAKVLKGRREKFILQEQGHAQPERSQRKL